MSKRCRKLRTEPLIVVCPTPAYELISLPDIPEYETVERFTELRLSRHMLNNPRPSFAIKVQNGHAQPVIQIVLPGHVKVRVLLKEVLHVRARLYYDGTVEQPAPHADFDVLNSIGPHRVEAAE